MKSFWLSLLLCTWIWADAHIFVYHRFGDSRYPSTNTTLEALRQDFTYFKEHHYTVVPLSKLVQALKAKEPIPDNWVVLTIDDNYKSFFQNGLALFKEFGYPFSMFVYVEATEQKYGDFMSWDELKETSKYGELEFHSMRHPHMTALSDEALKQDFDEGLALFEKHLNQKPHFFSYPFGEFSPRVKAIAQSYGFEAILNQNMGAVASFSDVYDLDRSALVGKSDLPNFLKYKALNATWNEPLFLGKDSKVSHLHVNTTGIEAKKGGIYISGHGYREITLNEGTFETDLNTVLTQERSRILVSIGNKISTKLLVKDIYSKQH
ncbi:MAG: polysaccharide deacetylase family protein [Sulfurospirillaceae bacterium]|nr:polysaccharide deacetylase family protein [Sulfurospirillaceae bacterium]